MGRKGRSIPTDDRIRIARAVVDQGLQVGEVAAAFDVSRWSVSRLVRSYREGGTAALREKSRRPHTSPQHLAQQSEEKIVELRMAYGWGPARIGAEVKASGSTVHRVLREHGLISPPQARPRYPRIESRKPGELVHLDSMSLTPLGRGRPSEHVFAAVDGYSREAFVQLYRRADGQASSSFLDYLLQHVPYSLEAVMTDNALIFTMSRSGNPQRQCPFERQLGELGIRHIRIRPQTPRTNGKVERWFGTLSRELLRRERFTDETHRATRVTAFVGFYNQQRLHSELGYRPPTQYRLDYFRHNT